MTNTIDDTQKLIDYSVDFATKMLTDHQEFFPFAVSIDLNGNLISTGYFDGDDNPSSQDLINKLQAALDQQLGNKERRACALTYDVRVQKDSSGEKTDAIVIKIKHSETTDTIVYYFAYRLSTQNEVEHLDSWGEMIP